MPESKTGNELAKDWENYEQQLFSNWFNVDGALQTALKLEPIEYLKRRGECESRVVSLIQELAKLQDIDRQRQILSVQAMDIQVFVLQRLQYVVEWLHRSWHIEVFYDPEKDSMLIWGLIDQWNNRDISKFP